jgi:hypothetical protein
MQGKGYGALADSIRLQANECIAEYFSVNSKTPALANNAVELNGSRNQAKYLNVIDSDGRGIFTNGGADHTIVGCTVQDADIFGIHVASDRVSVRYNHVILCVNQAVFISSSGDNNIIAGNYLYRANNSSFNTVEDNGSNNVIVANRVFKHASGTGIQDNSGGTSTIQDNKEAA